MQKYNDGMQPAHEPYGVLLAFISAEFVRKGGRQCIGVDLNFCPGDGYRDELLRRWDREDEPDLFNANSPWTWIEDFVEQILEIAEDHVKEVPGHGRDFIMRVRHHLGGRALTSFTLPPTPARETRRSRPAPGATRSRNSSPVSRADSRRASPSARPPSGADRPGSARPRNRRAARR